MISSSFSLRRAELTFACCSTGRPRPTHSATTAGSARSCFSSRTPAPAEGAASTSRLGRQVSLLAPRCEGQVAGSCLSSTPPPINQGLNLILRRLIWLVLREALPSRLTFQANADLPLRRRGNTNCRFRLPPHLPHLLPLPLHSLALYTLPQRLNFRSALLRPLPPPARSHPLAEHRE